MYLKGFVRYHKLNVTIFLFLVLFTLVHLLKPGLVYDKDGSFREFGVGYRHKTVIPIWVVSIVLAILSYIAVSYYLLI
jgi:hypothetical protein|uniref:Uncharacterized protein n=1 Tax=viral metagenome TaxID=1070528 RepID=A0A6C0L9L7_9ZZZZ